MILQNAVKIVRKGRPDLYLKSRHRHDYVSEVLPDGTNIFLDGGDLYSDGGYYTRSNKEIPFQTEDYSVESYFLDEKDSFEKIAKHLLWGTRGKDGKEPLRYIPLAECEKSHLEAIISQCDPSPLHKAVIVYLLATL